LNLHFKNYKNFPAFLVEKQQNLSQKQNMDYTAAGGASLKEPLELSYST
jgi:hypothetical protein